VTTAEHVDVQMWNALTGRLGVVDHDSIAALGDFHLIRNLRRGVHQVSQQ